MEVALHWKLFAKQTRRIFVMSSSAFFLERKFQFFLRLSVRVGGSTVVLCVQPSPSLPPLPS